ncbi:beta strand repeat-containing protein [Leptolyngbya sp. GGD]|uniref:beta strand repeat-containing protein n=1 Tax=Leptolyngbya sp. GGD TaxID=2997907 RepID=UPI00227BCD0F|nr:S-layer family protein [Leptolyngbya sp. GGD]MCY6490544.1 S-layer family protein [Leptolyngbya sp. GGD]
MKQAAVGLMWVTLSTIVLGYADTVLRMDRVDAQVLPDTTLGTTVQTPNNLNFTIEGGTRSGGNLFHSFSQFSVPTGGSASFNNPIDVQNIFSRVTGGTVSNIDGLLQANGTANVFLLNPSGILFGANASLNVGGSFIGTTASSIKFADGAEFSAIKTSGTPLLTISAPVGLQMGTNAGAIQVQGQPPNFFVFSGLQVPAGKTLALVGGNIDLAQANLFAPDGHVELWAVKNTEISIDRANGWELTGTSPAPSDWGTVTLRQNSFVNAGGLFGLGTYQGGSIQVRARVLTVQDGSGLASSTSGSGTGQPITIKTTEFVDLLGTSAPDQFNRNGGLNTTAYNSGATAGDIVVDTPVLRLANGAWIQSSVSAVYDFFTGQVIGYSNDSNSGNISIRARDVEVKGDTPFPSPFLPPDTPLDFPGNIIPTAITTVLTAPGTNVRSGDISITADRVRLLEGGRISTDLTNFGSPFIPTGRTGDISIRAAESLEIEGVTRGGMVGAVISSLQPGTQGQGGNITIETNKLQLHNGGTISTALAGTGTSGNITIQAQDILVRDAAIDNISQTTSGIIAVVAKSGSGTGGDINLTADNLKVFEGGQIASATDGQGVAGNINVQVKNLQIQGVSQPLLGGQSLPSEIAASSSSAFAAGSVNLQADTLQVSDRAVISVSNTSSGDAGNLNIKAGTVSLNQASLQAQVNGGNQGNIHIQAADLLLLRQGSNIVTSATGASTGGNIKINAPIIVGLENSDIIANAVQGQGGNIQITTQGIIGLQYRDRLTLENDITASSEFGVNGTVEVNNVGVDPNSGLVELSTTLIDSNQQVAASCSGTQGSSFVVTGRGGMPQNPNQEVDRYRSWNDVRDLAAFHKTAIAPAPTQTAMLVEATNWHRNSQTGKVELVAAHSTSSTPSATCASTLNSTRSPI